MKEYWIKYNQLLKYVESDNIVHKDNHKFTKKLLMDFYNYSIEFAGEDSLKCAFCFYKLEDIINRIKGIWEEKFVDKLKELNEEFVKIK
jgi:hypothetical protein